MKSEPHLLVDVSGHGFGHASMTTAVLQALRTILPTLPITIRSGLPENWFASRLKGDFAYVEQVEGDVGLMMDNAFSVRRDDSYTAYGHLHADWSKQIDNETNSLV